MSARPFASGNISFGLVSIPVKLYSTGEASVGIHLNKRGVFTTRVNLRGLTRKAVTLRIVGKTRRGKTVVGSRRYHTCVPKIPSNGPKPLITLSVQSTGKKKG